MTCIDKYSFNDNDVENVRVFIRVRPLRDEEKTVKNKNLLEVNHTVISLKKSDTTKTFKFARIFDENSTQMDIYRCIAVPIVQQVLQGYNGTIFAYGQSGTGKTYTMIGDIFNTDLRGIVPNIFTHIFAQISLANNDLSYAVTATYLEIYNEEIRDLLSETPQKKLALREKPELGVFVNDLIGFTVNSLGEMMEILARGNKNRATGSTKLNESSSRSHAIFAILVETKNNVTGKTTFGKLNLVDLAGSERVHKTMATGDRLKEAGKINLSLSVLANVISALVDGKSTHIPYRNSKLTRLLQDSLGGNSLTAMIAMISPNFLDSQESLYTLMYADRVKHIQNRVTVNLDKGSLIQTLESKIIELRNQLQTLTLEEEKELKKLRKKSKTSLNKEELDKIEMEKNVLQNKIDMVQKKILVGGQNLAEKAQQQIELIENTAIELKHLDSSHQLLEEILYYKEKEKKLVGQSYATLQEEDKELDRGIEETEKLLAKATQILVTKEMEYQNEVSSLLHTNKSLAKEMGLVQFIMNQSTPKEYLDEIKSKITWDENMQEWQMKGIAYCGNNLRRSRSRSVTQSTSSKSVYFRYPSKTRK
ncbi:unnamed protein product [Phaedon cochleariae]|uniref:Kinesin-like protein n=1 Tax=Phaedon cochleariae TaxID=80249 RepID=A0A9P0DM80_PHACE|nr:unnamed protein product [Phaedon cochleariae]